MITKVGLRLGERYLLTERIAVGGMGEVWRAVDGVLDRQVAVKVLRSDLAAGSPFRQRFRAEARMAAMLSHPGIAAVYDYGEIGDVAYLIMELVPGEPLSAMISRQGALEVDGALDLLAQIARALHAAHLKGVVHRDVKPANVIVTPEGRALMTDFGIARMRHLESLTATGQVMGTAHYLAPEVARGETATPLSDVYALGVVGYECLAGWRPFDGVNQVAVATAHLREQPPPLPETLPSEVRSAIMSAMQKSPRMRPQSAEAYALLLEDLLRRRRSRAGHLARAGTPSTVPGVPASLPGAGLPVADPVAGPVAGAGTGAAVGVASGAPGSDGPPPGVPSEPPALLPREAEPTDDGRPRWSGPATSPLPVPPEDGRSYPSRADRRRSERSGPPAPVRLSPGDLRRGPLLALLGLIVMVAVAALLSGAPDDQGRPITPRTDPLALPTEPLSPTPVTTSAATTSSATTTTTTSETVSTTSSSSTSTSGSSAGGSTRSGGGPTTITQSPVGNQQIVDVRSEYYRGMTADQAAQILTDRGMVVQLRYEPSDRPEGTVVGVEPNGELVQGSTVVVVVANR